MIEILKIFFISPEDARLKSFSSILIEEIIHRSCYFDNDMSVNCQLQFDNKIII